jgi:hypothetical protein
LIESILNLPERLRTRVKLHYFGPSGEIVAAEFSEANIAGNLDNRGLVTKRDAVAAVIEADALLSLVYDSSGGPRTDEINGLMTTKVFDYFLSGKPIINVGPAAADVCVLAGRMAYREFHTFESSQLAELSRFIGDGVEDLRKFRQRSSTAELPNFTSELREILRDIGT